MFIRSERTGDREAIRAVHKLSFPTPWEADLVDRLRDAGKLSVSLVAEVNRTVVGHIAISPVSTEDGHVGAGIGPVAVWEFYRRQGIGAQLVEAGLATCRSARLGWAVALGDPSFYGRFGFRAAKNWGLEDEHGGGEAFQAIELIAGSMPVGASLVRYAPEFNAFK